jgi:hypothetical protein
VGTGGTIPLVRLNLTIIDDACGSTYGASGIATTTAGGGVCSITNSSSSLRSVACAWNVPQGDLVSIQGTVNASVFAGQGLACGADATYSGSCQSGSSGTCVCTFTMSAARSVVMSICHGG